MLSLDDDEVDLALCLPTSSACTSEMLMKRESPIEPYGTARRLRLSRWGLVRVDKLIARIEQYQKDEAEEAEENRRANAAR